MNITYYLGAGASANSLPLYNDFETRVGVFRDYIYHFQRTQDLRLQKKAKLYLDALDELIKNLDVTVSLTIDAFAHELYLKRNENYGGLNFWQLKYILSDYFLFEQLIKSKKTYLTQYIDQESPEHYGTYDYEITRKINTWIDPRYRSFIAPELINDRFPPNINIISWNYDIQLELGYARLRECSLDLAQQYLQVYPSPSTPKGVKLDASCIIKLNGTTGITISSLQGLMLENNVTDRSFEFHNAYIQNMLDVFEANYQRILYTIPFFKFAFEKEGPFHDQARIYAKEIINKTDILVVIGYSFHSFNDTTDRYVFSEAKNFKRVIFQLPTEKDYQRIKRDFLNVKTISEELIEYNDSVTGFIPSIRLKNKSYTI